MSRCAMPVLWYWLSSLVPAALLYLPAGRLIWVMRVRRLERKPARVTTEEERKLERRKANLNAGVIVRTFAFFFNRGFTPSI